MRAVIYIRKIEKMDRQQRRAKGQIWLYEAVAAYGLSGLNAANCPVERTERGKPYFAHRSDVHFSISHSGDYWACAVADGPVGLDLQFHKEGKLDNIPGRFFHPEEATWLEGKGREAFFEVWAAKESYVKWTGEGIGRSFGQFSVVDRKEVFFHRPVFEPDYSLCLCGGEAWEDVKIIRVQDPSEE